jgi:transglutaminase-like putative cysteine protease
LAEDARFRDTLRQIVPQRRGTANELIDVMDWIDRNLRYDHIQASLRADAQYAFTQRRGHCSDYHGLCAAMGRSLGFPTRVTYGLNLFPKNSPSHCKLEAFLPPYGWVSFDLSETQKLVQSIHAATDLSDEKKERLARAARQRLIGGFRDNTWLLVTKGTDYELQPPASQSVSVVRTIYAEADGIPLPDPDPANAEKREFSWMTVHAYQPDRTVSYPFQDWKTLEP